MKIRSNLLASVAMLCVASSCSYSLTAGGLASRSSGSSGGSQPSVSTGETSSHAGNGIVSGPEIWKRWAVRGIELGSTRAALVAKHFTCGKRANSRCYKLMDKRCETGLCEFKEDAFGQWFELNGAKTKLDFMTVGTTETDHALVYDIRLYFAPRQLLTLDSTLGKAMVSKYGAPTSHDEPSPGDPNGGGRMLWSNPELGSNGPEIVADCNAANNEPGGQCRLDVEDGGIQVVERSKQAEIDKQRMLSSQPTSAPAL